MSTFPRTLAFVFIVVVNAGFGQVSVQRPNKVHDPNRTEALTVVVRPDGFGESKICVPAGRYSLSIFNRSGIDDLPLTLDRMAGESSAVVNQALRNGKADAKTSHLVERLVLTKGSYRVQVPTRPTWVLRIEVD